MEKPNAVACMVGTGGMTVGVEAAGFHTLGFLEPNDTWGLPEQFNLPERVHTTCYEEWDEYIELWDGDVELVYMNPPCQGLTGANRNASADHWKNQMFVDAFRSAVRMHPRWIIAENIPRMLSLGAKIVEQAMEVADEAGYSFTWHRHEAGQFGAGQRRPRVMFVAERHPSWWPSFPHERTATAAECISDLEDVEFSLEGEPTPYVCEPKTEYQARMREGNGDLVFNHHWWKAPEEFENLEPGKSWMSLPDSELNATQITRRNEGRVYNAAEVHRLHPDEVAGTVTGMPNKMHYSDTRLVSTREAARFMGFPDWWVWPMNWNYAQMAAGVCPPVTEWYGRAMMHSLAGTEMEAPNGQLF